MRSGVQLGRIFGTDIYADSSFFLVLAFSFLGMGGGDRLGYVALFFVALVPSLLVHEFGHVFAVRWLLRKPSIVVLWGFGGLCIHEPARHPRQQVGISLMGPLFGFVLGAAVWAWREIAPPSTPALATFCDLMLYMNVAWTAVNLLPVTPLDGGNALRAALAWRFPARNLGRFVTILSIVVSAGLAAFCVATGRTFAALLCVWMVLQNVRMLRPGV